ncbi:MAG: hypothetical protein AB2605_02495 [Candidatus Thiodiazotropha sp.]
MQTVVFYSYKGGVGRSLVLANVAQFLARLGQCVFSLDFDLEAPGLHYKFALNNNIPQKGVIDYLLHCQDKGFPPSSLNDLVSMLDGDYPSGGSITLMPAGRAPSREYAAQLGRLDWLRLFGADPTPGVSIFADLQEQIRQEYDPDFLLIDSRTGMTHIGQVALHLLADKLVCLLLNNPENLDGLIDVLKEVKDGHSNSKISTNEFEILPVLSRVPQKHDHSIKRAVKTVIHESLGLHDLFVLHSERELEINETLRIGGTRSAALSILLRDYVRLCRRLFPNNGIVPPRTKDALDRLSVEEDRADSITLASEEESLIPVPIRSRIESRKNKDKGAWFVVANGKYIAGESYRVFVTDLIKRIVSADDKIKEIPSNKIKWELLATQIRDGVFDFCQDPYIVTTSRSHLLGVLRFGHVKTFTIYVRKDSAIHSELMGLYNRIQGEEDWTFLYALKHLRQADSLQEMFSNRIDNGEEQDVIAGWEDTAATSECQWALAQEKSGAVAATFSSTNELYEWICDKPDKGERMIVCDHGVVQMLNKKNDEGNGNPTFVGGTPELTFRFKPKSGFPVGYAYPIEDEEWGRLLAECFADLVTNEILTKDKWEGVTLDLKNVEIEALEFKDLCLSIMANMRYDDGIRWYDSLPEKLIT